MSTKLNDEIMDARKTVTPNMGAFPQTFEDGFGKLLEPGLSKREYFAAMIMSEGIKVSLSYGLSNKDIAERAVGMADALMIALNMVKK